MQKKGHLRKPRDMRGLCGACKGFLSNGTGVFSKRYLGCNCIEKRLRRLCFCKRRYCNELLEK